VSSARGEALPFLLLGSSISLGGVRVWRVRRKQPSPPDAFAGLGRYQPVRAVVKTILPFYIPDEPMGASPNECGLLAYFPQSFCGISTIDKHYPVRHYGCGHFVFPSRREEM
jgi:hypothetical protein